MRTLLPDDPNLVAAFQRILENPDLNFFVRKFSEMIAEDRLTRSNIQELLKSYDVKDVTQLSMRF